MNAGRPPRDFVDDLKALAQQRYLREALDVDRNGLAEWLKLLGEGAMADRDVRRFLAHQATISQGHAEIIDKAAPGLSRLTYWPWRALFWDTGSPKLWRIAHEHLRKAMRAPFECQPVRARRGAAKFHSIGTSKQWWAVETFFYMLIEFRRQLAHPRGSEPENFARCLVTALQDALAHPVFGSFKQALSYCLLSTLDSAGARRSIWTSGLAMLIAQTPPVFFSGMLDKELLRRRISAGS